jgi:hypothetical protein
MKRPGLLSSMFFIFLVWVSACVLPMTRPLRLAYPGAFYHVSCRGNARQAIMRDDQDGLAGRAAEREQPARRALAQAWDLDAAVEALAEELGCEVAELCRRGGGLERALVMECLYRYTGASQRTIGQKMGGVDYSRASRQRKELREALARAPHLQAQFARLQRILEARVKI